MGTVYRQIERPYVWLQSRFERFSPSLLFWMGAAAALLAALGVVAIAMAAANGEVIATVICAAATACALWLAVRWSSVARTVLWARGHFPAAKAICGGRENGPVLSTAPRILVATDDGVAEVAGRLIRGPEVLQRVPYTEVTHFRVILDEIEVRTADAEFSWVGIPPAQAAEFASVVEPHID
jgi:hypothetical protein